MSLTLIAILIALIGVGGAVVKSYSLGEEHGEAKIQARLVVAEKARDELAAKINEEAKNHIDDMTAAFQAGESMAKTVYVKAQDKGASDVARFPVFSNPVCVLPDESLGNLNAARGAIFGVDSLHPDGINPSQPVPATSNPGGANATVPATGAPATPGREIRNTVPAVNPGHRPLGSVH